MLVFNTAMIKDWGEQNQEALEYLETEEKALSESQHARQEVIKKHQEKLMRTVISMANIDGTINERSNSQLSKMSISKVSRTNSRASRNSKMSGLSPANRFKPSGSTNSKFKSSVAPS